jgi:hypothetical protein
VAIECANVIGCGKTKALIGLRHQIADVNLGGGRGDDSLGDAMHQQVRNEAGKERTRTDADDIRAGDGVESLRQRLDIGRNQKQLLDATFTCGNVGLAAYTGAVFHQRFEFDIRRCGGMDVSTGDENFRGEPHRFSKILSDGSQRRQE